MYVSRAGGRPAVAATQLHQTELAGCVIRPEDKGHLHRT